MVDLKVFLKKAKKTRQRKTKVKNVMAKNICFHELTSRMFKVARVWVDTSCFDKYSLPFNLPSEVSQCFVHLNLELTYNEIMTQNSNLVSRFSSLLYLTLFLTTKQQSIEVIET